MKRQASISRNGFTMVEVMTVIAIVAVLLGLLFPVLAGVRKSGEMTKSMAHMRQIAGWMNLYSSDNRDTVLPSQFNYSPELYPGIYPGKVRSEPVSWGSLHTGTWADILWTEFTLGVFPQRDTSVGGGGNDTGDQQGDPDGGTLVRGIDYRYDSPDAWFYGVFSPSRRDDFDNPLRSAAKNLWHTHSRHDLATPWGAGAGEVGLPGYFAANNFFNADEVALDKNMPSVPVRPGTTAGQDQGRWYSQAQIRAPARSMYLVDSFAGEVIQQWPMRYKLELVEDANNSILDPDPSVPQQNQVDFRYSDQCLMLFLDGHIQLQARWAGIEDLEGNVGQGPTAPEKNRGIRIRRLDKR